MLRQVVLTLCLVGSLAQQSFGPPPLAGPVAPAPAPPFPGPPPPPPGSCNAGFSARKVSTSTQTSRGSGVTVRFQDVLTNRGGFSRHSGVFTAPCYGLYYFSFHGVAVDRSDFTLALMKNGQFQVTAYGGKGNYQQGSNSALLDLNTGDRIYLELQQGDLYEHPFNEAYTSFNGFLVQRY